MHLTSFLAAAKLGVVSRQQAIARAISLGLIGNQAQPCDVANDLLSTREGVQKACSATQPLQGKRPGRSRRGRPRKSPRPGPLQSQPSAGR